MLTRREKRLIVQGRLLDPDTAALSDRAIARELDVSQPFVGSVRRRLALRSSATRETEEVVAREPVVNRRPPHAGAVATGNLDVLGVEPDRSSTATDGATSAQAALDRFHNEHSGIGRIVRVWRSGNPDEVADGVAQTEPFNPFDE